MCTSGLNGISRGTNHYLEEDMRVGMKNSTVTLKSVKNTLQRTPLIEAKIQDTITGIVFAITLDGWTAG
jgi:hypothetical protein